METSAFDEPAPVPGSDLVQASTGKRFVNCLADLIIFYVLFFEAHLGLVYFARVSGAA